MRSVWKYKAEAKAAQQQRSSIARSSSSIDTLHAVLAAAQHGRLGISFSGASFGSAYQLGAAMILQQLGLIGSDTPISGASAGGIVAVATRCGLAQVDVLRALTEIAQDLIQHGEKKRMRGVLKTHLEQVLPSNAYQLCSSSIAMISDLVSSSSSSHPRYHPVQPEHQAAADRQSPVSCSAQAGGRPQSNPQPQSTQQLQPTLQHSQQGPDTVLGGCTPQRAAPAGIVVPGSISGSSSSRAIGGSSSSSSTITGTPPLLLGATRVRFCCPGCLQPDVFVGGYSSNEELVDALLTGTHMSLVSDGSLWTHFRGHRYVDSGLRDTCPPIPGVDHTLIVYPVPNKLFKRPWPYRIMMKPPLQDAITISPGQYGRAWPYTKSYKKSNDLVMHAKPAGVLNMLFERGRRDALAWAQYIGLEPEHVQQLRGGKAARQGGAGVVGSRTAGAAAPAGPAAAATTVATTSPGEDLSWLSISPDDLPVVVPVPNDLMHFLRAVDS